MVEAPLSNVSRDSSTVEGCVPGATYFGGRRDAGCFERTVSVERTSDGRDVWLAYVVVGG